MQLGLSGNFSIPSTLLCLPGPRDAPQHPQQLPACPGHRRCARRGHPACLSAWKEGCRAPRSAPCRHAPTGHRAGWPGPRGGGSHVPVTFPACTDRGVTTSRAAHVNPASAPALPGAGSQHGAGVLPLPPRQPLAVFGGVGPPKPPQLLLWGCPKCLPLAQGRLWALASPTFRRHNSKRGLAVAYLPLLRPALPGPCTRCHPAGCHPLPQTPSPGSCRCQTPLSRHAPPRLGRPVQAAPQQPAHPGVPRQHPCSGGTAAPGLAASIPAGFWGDRDWLSHSGAAGPASPCKELRARDQGRARGGCEEQAAGSPRASPARPTCLPPLLRHREGPAPHLRADSSGGGGWEPASVPVGSRQLQGVFGDHLQREAAAHAVPRWAVRARGAQRLSAWGRGAVPRTRLICTSSLLRPWGSPR